MECGVWSVRREANVSGGVNSGEADFKELSDGGGAADGERGHRGDD